MYKVQTLSQFQVQFGEYMQEHPLTKYPQGLYEPADYLLQLGGKRMRPMLVMMGMALYEENTAPALPLAYAIEVFHNFTLAHDDIMDAAPLRRGKPTMHHRYGENQAILTGDVMFIKAYDYLLKTQQIALLPEMLALFNRTAMEVCEGQQLDMEFENRETVELSEYLNMIDWKTAVLLGCSLQLGGMEGNAPPADWKHLYEYGRQLGIAFQLQDDLLDTYGNPETFGKKVGGDIIQGKKTGLVIKALERANEEQQRELNNWLHREVTTAMEEKEKIAAVVKIFDKLQVKAAINDLKSEYEQAAIQHLSAVQVAPRKKEPLQQLAAFLMERNV